jgi:hypothetical protein
MAAAVTDHLWKTKHVCDRLRRLKHGTTGMNYPRLYIFILLSVLNFVAFIGVTHAIGGNGLNGFEENGRYFVREKGRVTEVSPWAFHFSKWHLISVLITFPFACLAGAYSRMKEKYPDRF